MILSPHRGKFVTVEGCEGSGKSTLVNSLYKYFSSQGLKVIYTKEPGGTKFGMALRGILLDTESAYLDPWTEVYLFCADRHQHITESILPALKGGSLVLCDRFSASTIAYQHYGRGLDLQSIIQMDELARQGLSPDINILLDIDPKFSFSRIDRTRDKFEQEGLEFHRKIREGFLSQARSDESSWLIIDATLVEDKIFEKAKRHVRKLLESKTR